MQKAQIGMIGLAVMGENLSLNLERHGFTVAVYNIEPEKYVRAFLEGPARGKSMIGCYSLAELVSVLEKPRRIWLMIRAGSPVDEVIDELVPLLEPGDIVIDGGNSNFADTARRARRLEEHALRFVGMGVSGGGEGALNGPSLMPGGTESAWPEVKPVLQAIAARAEGEPCCDWMGSGGAGHFVKMVHNGIEYGDMQLISEAYLIMRDALGMTPDDMSAVFGKWNQGVLNSYLIGITAEILKRRDADGAPLINKILDTAGQKGTGRWTGIAALEEGAPLTLIAESVFARCLSANKDLRVRAAGAFGAPDQTCPGEIAPLIDDLEQALYASKIVSYAQGFELLRAAAGHYGWQLNYGGIAMVWRGGCIIRSRFLGEIYKAMTRRADFDNLMLDEYFAAALDAAQAGWRRTCALAISRGLPSPALTSALSYFDGLRTASSGANLIQAQRDYFGAHTYERVDAPRGDFFHTDWTALGTAASTTYNA